jgi:hypothetical protein
MRTLTGLLPAAVLLAIGVGASPASAYSPLAEAEIRAMMTSQQRHVRPIDGRVSHAVEEGLRRSATFASLVLALDRSNVIVYIETAYGLPSSLAGRMLIAAGPAGTRYLRIQVALAPGGYELIALIGHELRHALEVAGFPEVRDAPSLQVLYQTIGHKGQGLHYYDTMAAQDAGRQVLAELIG